MQLLGDSFMCDTVIMHPLVCTNTGTDVNVKPAKYIAPGLRASSELGAPTKLWRPGVHVKYRETDKRTECAEQPEKELLPVFIHISLYYKFEWQKYSSENEV